MKKKIQGLGMAALLLMGLTACGGGGGSNSDIGNNGSNGGLIHRSSAQVYGDLRFPARLAIDHVSFATRAAVLPWKWLLAGPGRSSCSQGTMKVTHKAANGAVEDRDTAIADDTYQMHSDSCTFDLFANWRGDMIAQIYSVTGHPASDTYDATLAVGHGYTFSWQYAATKRTPLITGGANLAIHKGVDGFNVNVSVTEGEHWYVQDTSENGDYPQLTFTDVKLLVSSSTGPASMSLDTVTGHMTFKSGHPLVQSGRIVIDSPIKLSNNWEGATAGKMTITLASGTVTVLTFSGSGQGNVKVLSAPSAGAAFTEVYNGSVAELLSNF